MKTLKSFAAALLLATAGISSAQASIVATPVPASVNELVAKTLIQDQINDHIGFPKTANKKRMTGSVNFIFRINELNKVEVLDIYGDNENLVNYVEESIDGFKIRYDSSLQGKAYRMVINFNPSL